MSSVVCRSSSATKVVAGRSLSHGTAGHAGSVAEATGYRLGLVFVSRVAQGNRLAAGGVEETCKLY